MPLAPEDIANEACDLFGYAGAPIGSFQTDGSHAANVAIRQYLPTLRLLFRAAPWNFARKAAPLTLLQDATGNTPGAGTNVPPPFLYEYQFPNDGVKVRFIPWNWSQQNNGAPAGNIAVPAVPNFPVAFPSVLMPRLALAKFAVAIDDSLPIVIGDPTAPDAPAAPDWSAAEGEGPLSQKVVLCDVPPDPATGAGAMCVYTKLTLVPETWDPAFHDVFVRLLGARMAVPVLSRQDPKLRSAAMAQARALSMEAKDAVLAARAMDNNEGMTSFDHVPDWVRARRGGYGYGGFGGAYGSDLLGSGLYSGFDSVSFPGLASF